MELSFESPDTSRPPWAPTWQENPLWLFLTHIVLVCISYSMHMLWSASLQYAHALAEMPLSVIRALGCDPGLFAHSEASMKASCLFGEFPSTESQESQNL